MNNHLTHSKYVDLVEDCRFCYLQLHPQNEALSRPVKYLNVEYLREARFGDTLEMHMYELSPTCHFGHFAFRLVNLTSKEVLFLACVKVDSIIKAKM